MLFGYLIGSNRAADQLDPAAVDRVDELEP